VTAGITRADEYDTRSAKRRSEVCMGIIAFLILGLLAGAIAKALLPGDDPGGIIITTALGVVGALVGGFLAAALFGAHPLDDFFDLSTWATAIVGSMILLAVYRLIVGDGHHHHHRGVLR
jgi:uncharacterized membrane protein YeaQ/YmgE (transglycosylase-associated protein family)